MLVEYHSVNSLILKILIQTKSGDHKVKDYKILFDVIEDTIEID